MLGTGSGTHITESPSNTSVASSWLSSNPTPTNPMHHRFGRVSELKTQAWTLSWNPSNEDREHTTTHFLPHQPQLRGLYFRSQRTSMSSRARNTAHSILHHPAGQWGFFGISHVLSCLFDRYPCTI